MFYFCSINNECNILISYVYLESCERLAGKYFNLSFRIYSGFNAEETISEIINSNVFRDLLTTDLKSSDFAIVATVKKNHKYFYSFMFADFEDPKKNKNVIS